MIEFFDGVTAPIAYEGPDSDNPLAFRWYDPDRVVAGRRMAEHLRFAACYWHSFASDGFDIFGAGTLDRPWITETTSGRGDPMDHARTKMAAAFEFFSKLGIPYYCFHDRDIAPEGSSFKESAANVDARTVDEGALKRSEKLGFVIHGRESLEPADPLHDGRPGQRPRPGMKRDPPKGL